MSRFILYTALLLLLSRQGSAQSAMVDSLLALNNTLRDNSGKNVVPCGQKIYNYSQALAAIPIFELDSTINHFLSINNDLLKSPLKNCYRFDAVKRLDSMIRTWQPADDADSANFLNAVSYTKYRLKDYISLKVNIPDSVMQLASPHINISSTETFVSLPKNNYGDQLFEVLVQPGKTYSLTVTANGYSDLHSNIIAPKQDTTISVELIKNEVIDNPVDPVEADNRSFWERFWWLPLLLLAAIGLIAWKFMPRRSSLSRKGVYKGNIEQELINKDHIIENSRKQIEKMHADNLALLHKTKNTGATIGEGKTFPDKKYFVSEILMTAGPRKKPMNESNSDKDLGEDVSGFVMAGNEILVWLLDGTSDFYCLRDPVSKREYFSSRLLAQSIARKLKASFSRNRSEALDTTVNIIINEVRSDWMKVISGLPDPEKSVLKKNIDGGNFPECAATILVGKLSLEGDLTVYRSGDCKMILFTGTDKNRSVLNTTLADKNEKSNDRIFFRLIVTENGELNLVHNTPLFEIVRHHNVQTMIGYSDGIGSKTEQLFRLGYAKDPEGVREELIYQMQGTEDDKALYIIEIKES